MKAYKGGSFVTPLVSELVTTRKSAASPTARFTSKKGPWYPWNTSLMGPQAAEDIL